MLVAITGHTHLWTHLAETWNHCPYQAIEPITSLAPLLQSDPRVRRPSGRPGHRHRRVEIRVLGCRTLNGVWEHRHLNAVCLFNLRKSWAHSLESSTHDPLRGHCGTGSPKQLARPGPPIYETPHSRLRCTGDGLPAQRTRGVSGTRVGAPGREVSEPPAPPPHA